MQVKFHHFWSYRFVASLHIFVTSFKLLTKQVLSTWHSSISVFTIASTLSTHNMSQNLNFESRSKTSHWYRMTVAFFTQQLDGFDWKHSLLQHKTKDWKTYWEARSKKNYRQQSKPFSSFISLISLKYSKFDYR